ncbi:glycosyltransferase family 4 protein [Exiguobacterium sp. s95]|uniref:glycosyltransferase family 4 protein n=1 Tax=Exiguobacterium sp. s95 TaxID=2751211 RepID=UPI001BE9B0BA|nr:glycosyltransferase family 4 protein [Exiguobacterium sp. s95]
MSKEKKMRIALLAAGSDVHAVRWANKLNELGHEVHLIFQKNHDLKQDQVSNQIKIYKLNFKKTIGYYLNAIELKKILNKINPDILNAHYASGYGTLARLTNFHPCIISVYGSDVYDFPYKSKINMNIIKKNLNYADGIASTSHVMANQTIDLGIKHELKDIKITPFGVDTNKFKRNDRNTSNEKIIIGSIKKLSPKYGLEYSIKAIKYMIDNKMIDLEKLNFEYRIYGEGNQKEEFEKFIKLNNLEKYIKLKGRVPNTQVPNELNNFDIFIGSSILESESFGVAIVEAMACEVPVIVSNVGGFKEVVGNGQYGVVFERKNVKELADKIIDLIENPEKRRKMGELSRKRVLDEYDWENNSNLMVDFMKNIKKEFNK